MKQRLLFLIACWTILGSTEIVTADDKLFIGLTGGYFMPINWDASHDIVYGQSGEPSYGLELGYRFKIPLELAVAWNMIDGEGERVSYGHNEHWEKTGEKISFSLTPITFHARWRFWDNSLISPYVGAGFGYVRFKETGAISTDGIGGSIQIGMDINLPNSFSTFFVGDYGYYPNVIGDAGVSRFLHEDNVGGMTIRLGIKYTLERDHD